MGVLACSPPLAVSQCICVSRYVSASPNKGEYIIYATCSRGRAESVVLSDFLLLAFVRLFACFGYCWYLQVFTVRPASQLLALQQLLFYVPRFVIRYSRVAVNCGATPDRQAANQPFTCPTCGAHTRIPASTWKNNNKQWGSVKKLVVKVIKQRLGCDRASVALNFATLH